MGENIGSGGTAWTHYDLATLNRNTWYCLELAVHPNTPGVYNDGWYRLWVNGTEVNYGTNDHLHVDFRHNQTGNIGQVRVGDQVQRYNYNVLNEYRYWDDIVVSTSYIGP